MRLLLHDGELRGLHTSCTQRGDSFRDATISQGSSKKIATWHRSGQTPGWPSDTVVNVALWQGAELEMFMAYWTQAWPTIKWS